VEGSACEDGCHGCVRGRRRCERKRTAAEILRRKKKAPLRDDKMKSSNCFDSLFGRSRRGLYLPPLAAPPALPGPPRAGPCAAVSRSFLQTRHLHGMASGGNRTSSCNENLDARFQPHGVREDPLLVPLLVGDRVLEIVPATASPQPIPCEMQGSVKTP